MHTLTRTRARSQNRRTIHHLLRGAAFTSMAQRKDSEHEIITSCSDGRIVFWDCDYAEPVEVRARATRACALAHSHACTCQPRLSVPRAAANALSLSPSGRFLAVGASDCQVHVLDLRSGRLVAQGHGHSEQVLSLQWTPDEKQLVSGGEDGAVCVWNFYGVE